MVFITRDMPKEAIEKTLTAFEEAVEETPSPTSSSQERGEQGPGATFSRPRVRPP